jgi:hypothetical protein
MSQPQTNAQQASLKPAQEPWSSASSSLGRRILIQHTALAGFRHHAAPQLWPALVPNALLTLRREADNPHDPDAVALYWRGCKLGYLPRGENLVVARLLDRRRPLSARIEGLAAAAERNRRIRLAVLLH